MSHETLIMTSIIGRALIGIACVAGTVYLAGNNKPGWGWLIFLALATNLYSLIAKG